MACPSLQRNRPVFSGFRDLRASSHHPDGQLRRQRFRKSPLGKRRRHAAGFRGKQPQRFWRNAVHRAVCHLAGRNSDNANPTGNRAAPYCRTLPESHIPESRTTDLRGLRVRGGSFKSETALSSSHFRGNSEPRYGSRAAASGAASRFLRPRAGEGSPLYPAP